jgi:flagellar basal-body rod protein FlgB
MSISFDNALGIHEKALGFRAQRAEVLASNIANADTPNYRARDLDFAAVLAEQSAKGARQPVGLQRTDSQHIAAEGIQQEQSNYAENAVQFQASFTLLNSKFKGLVSALRGE